MDITLNICITDGTEILIDGFDKISFYNTLPISEVTHSGYTWQKDHYNTLLNNLVSYNFISVTREYDDLLEYHEHSYNFKNSHSEEKKPLILRTSAVTTIIDMYN